MNLVLIPAWVEKALVANGHGVKDALNPEILFATLSREDVVFYAALNRTLGRWLPTEVNLSFSSPFRAGGMPSQASTQNLQQVINEMEESIIGMEVEFLTRKEKGMSPDPSELFGPLAEPVPVEDITYSVVTLAQDTVAIIPRNGTGTSLIGMVDDLLFLVNGRLDYNTMVKLPLFKYFLAQV